MGRNHKKVRRFAVSAHFLFHSPWDQRIFTVALDCLERNCNFVSNLGRRHFSPPLPAPRLRRSHRRAEAITVAFQRHDGRPLERAGAVG